MTTITQGGGTLMAHKDRARRQAETGSRASAEPAARLGPTGFDPARWPEVFVDSLPWRPMADAPRDGTVFAACYHPWDARSNPKQIQAVQWLPSGYGTFAFRAAYQPDSTAYADGWLTFEEVNAIAMEARSVETAGLHPKDDSAGPQDIAQPPSGDPQ